MGGGERGKRPIYNQKSKTINKKVTIYNQQGEIQKPKKNVFISFHMGDRYAKELLGAQAKSDRFDLEFTNYAVDEPFDEKWKTQCKERIAMTSTMIVLIGPETHQREAVNWEINEAYRQGKKVIGVRIHRYEKHKIPKDLIDNNAPIINWDIEEISKLLNEED